jgi:glycosyltransferase involved in cell wall biosynthesis
MKALVFTSLYPNNIWPHHGVFVKERMTRFAKLEGCQVKVVAPVPYFPPIKISHRWLFSQVLRQETLEGIEVSHPRYFITPKIGMASYGLLMFLSVVSTVKKIRTGFDFDLIDAHYVYPDGFAAVLLGAFFDRPVVVSARGSDINLFAEFPLIRRLLQYTLRRADRVIAVSEALKKAMIQMRIREEKISIISNGVDLGKFFPFPKEHARKKLGLPDTKIILTVGNLTANKGFDLLIRALRILVDEFREEHLHLVIVGEGGFRKDLEQLARSLAIDSHIRFAGDIPHEELHLWYNAADLFCLASGREGTPNVVLESLACGIPVVATAVGGIPEIICTDNLGLLTPRSAREIAATIVCALRRAWNTDLLRQYAARRTWDRVALSVRGVFESALQVTDEFSHKHPVSRPTATNHGGRE